MLLVIFFVCFFLSVLSLDRRSAFLDKGVEILLLLVLTIFAGTRNADFDRDYEEYARIFSLWLNDDLDFRLLLIYEPMLFIVPFFNELLFGNALSIKMSFVTFAFLALYYKISTLRKYGNFFLGTILYSSYLLFSQEMTTIRAGVACAIFLSSIPALESRNDKLFFKKLIIAFSFHYSSLVFLVAWLVVRIKLSIKVFYYALLVSFIIAIFKINILTALKLDLFIPKVKMYLDLMERLEEISVNVFNFRILISIFFIVLFTWKRRILETKSYFLVLFKVHFLSVILFFSLSPTAMVFSLRVFDMLAIIQLLLYPMIVYVFKDKIIPYGIILLLCAINLYYIIQISEWFGEYSSWLF